jgi:CubicO group peptidase (beta-lactamase class C family)
MAGFRFPSTRGFPQAPGWTRKAISGLDIRSRGSGLDGEKLASRLDSLASYALKENIAPGLQLLVARDQKVVFHKTYGYHTYDSLEEVRKDDLYDFASVTKITSSLPALMRLHDQQKFDLDA